MEDFDALDVPDRRAQLLAWLTPTRKIALVGGVTLLPALGVGLMLNGLFFPTASSQARPEPPKLAARLQVPPVEQPVGELDRLKAQVALADQQKLLERLAPPTLPAVKPTPRPVRRIVPPPRLTLQTLPVLPPPQAAPQQWHELANLGSATEVPAGRVAPVAMTGVSTVGAPANLAMSVSTLTLPARMTATSLDPALETGVDTGGTTQPAFVGGATRPAIAATTLATGILERPILWEERKGVRGSESERHVVVLTESLGIGGSVGEDGPQLAEGTRILAVVQDISANGIVTMQAVALRVDDREVPLQGVSIRAVGGLPLMASRNDKGQEFSTLDSGQALLKGAERGFDTFNRPTSLNQVFTPGGSNFSASYGRDPLAALGAGIFGELAETVRERNRQAVRQIQSRPDLWYLPGGTAVELLFGREIRL